MMDDVSKHLPGNPHAATYETHFENVYFHDEDRLTNTAIMALAYEQRTANLIAVLRPLWERGVVGEYMPEIMARLGYERSDAS
jgi:hypothetical protein